MNSYNFNKQYVSKRYIHSESPHKASAMSYCCQFTANYFVAAKPSFETVAHGKKVQDCQEEVAAQKRQSSAKHRKQQGHKLVSIHFVHDRINFT